MIYNQVKMQKTVEGTYHVMLINDNVVVGTIVFPTETLAKEYAEFKIKGESGPESPATKAVLKDLNGMISNDKHEQVMDAFYAQNEAQTEQGIETVAGLDLALQSDEVSVSTRPVVKDEEPEGEVVAKAPKTKNRGTQPKKVDTSAKAAKDVEIDVSAKAATTEAPASEEPVTPTAAPEETSSVEDVEL